MAIKNKIKLIREEKKISRKELAKRVGISYWALCKYENNERTPDIELFWKIAQELEVSIEYVAGLVKEENSLSNPSMVIQKIYLLPAEAIEEVNLFVDFLNYKYQHKSIKK
ncbi:transcriptional regulator [Carboxydothermus islandicus]|uniref:Transcriptional regulator n=1 Tax=Carboxydothermus islandicus TaxID=661089 RepID=A0A1L8D4V3_9THEO|nr:helix-turn-helix transcriptional regulator [Carboxydothermus islandicus]GAV26188.1 transcriptional regulator [Carboxydothermus islandicus]